MTDVISTPPETCAWERWRKQKEQEEASRTRSMQSSICFKNTFSHFFCLLGERSLSPETNADTGLDPESLSDEWMYTEHMIYMPVCSFCSVYSASSGMHPLAYFFCYRSQAIFQVRLCREPNFRRHMEGRRNGEDPIEKGNFS